MTTSIKLQHPLILASASPRRRQLLTDAGYTFDVIPPTVDEPAPTDNADPAAYAEQLAYLKAQPVADLHPTAVTVGADTIVTHTGKIIGKPRDQAHARQILTTLFGGHNDVITGLAILCPALDKRIVTHVRTTIVIRPMQNDELEAYLVTGAWRDKAGAYALQEGGDKFVQSIQGSQSNIVGLPMEKLAEILETFKQ